MNTENMASNDSRNGCHIQNSNTESITELEPSSRTELGAKLPIEPYKPKMAKAVRSAEPPKAFPLGMVLRACPQINDYGAGGQIANWREFMSTAVLVKSMLGVSPSAYEEACGVMGPENAAVAIACILERSNFINSAGGYLRDLTRRSERGEFSLGPMLMALLKTSGVGAKLAG